MAWPIGRLWRVCMVGVGVCVALWWCVQALCIGVDVRCYGVVCTVLWRWVYVWLACVYGVQALGVRVYVVL